MARKPAPTPAEAATLVTVTVIDALNHDGEVAAPGDELELPLETALALRSAGVVAFADPVPSSPAV